LRIAQLLGFSEFAVSRESIEMSPESCRVDERWCIIEMWVYYTSIY